MALPYGASADPAGSITGAGMPGRDSPATVASLGSLVDAVRGWLDNFVQLVALEGKQAARGLALMVGFGLGAVVLLLTGWLALVGCAVVALVENDILGWAASLLLAALMSMAGTAGLVFLAIKRSRDLLFSASWRQLGRQSSPPPDHE